jgi:glycosyltransferase involved in cell wall biosynthesis
MAERSLQFLIPGDLQAATGGYGYDRRIIAGLRALGWQVAVHALDASFPQPVAGALEQAHRILARLPEQALVLIDGLAAGAMPQVIERHSTRLCLLALVHHPLAAEAGLAANLAQDLAESERRTLRAVRHVLVTSHATRRVLAAYGVEPARASVVEPGTDAAPLAHPRHSDTLRMLCVANLIPRKGHDLLFEALAPLAPAWHLTCVGSLERSPQTVESLRAQLRRLGLADRVTLAGEVDASTLSQYYCRSDLVVLPSRYEGYGMAVAEALAHGLPVIGTAVGAIPELVGASAGVVIAAGEIAPLRATLNRVLAEPALLYSLAEGAAAVRDTLPTWPQACARMSQVLSATGRGEPG